MSRQKWYVIENDKIKVIKKTKLNERHTIHNKKDLEQILTLKRQIKELRQKYAKLYNKHNQKKYYWKQKEANK